MTPSSELIAMVAPAFVAGLMVAITHAPLGLEVLKRGIIFIDLAIAQIAGLGLVAASIFIHDAHPAFAQGAALAIALTAALFFRWTERIAPHNQEAIIGSAFVLAASLALLLLSNDPHGGEEMTHLLSGQILFATWSDVAVHAPIYGVILLLWFWRPSLRKGIGFYALFAIAVTSSVQLVGVYVVFASLILPALTAKNSGTPHVTAWTVGILSSSAGLILSLALDYPAGPMIVTSYMCAGAFFAVRALIHSRL